MHYLTLTKIQQVSVELTDAEYEEYKESDPYDYLEPWWSDMDVVERTIEEE